MAGGRCVVSESRRAVQTTTYQRPRQSDVARLAGVSQSAVSLVLSGKDSDRGITEETRQRVLEAAASIGYRANSAARRLRGQSSQLLGVHTYGDIFPLGFQNYNYEYLIGVHLAAEQAGFDLVLFSSTRVGPVPGVFSGGEENRLGVADGSIIVGGRGQVDDFVRLASERYPFVHIGRREVPGLDIAWVSSDYARGAEHMVEQLVAAGHDRLLYLGTDPQSESESARERRAGFRRGVKRTKLSANVELPPRESVNAAWVSDLPRRGVRTIIAEDHDLAHRVVVAATESGLRFRTDIAVAVLAPPMAGEFDSGYCGFLVEHREEIGWRAGRLLVDLVEGRDPSNRQILVDCQASVSTYGFVPL